MINNDMKFDEFVSSKMMENVSKEGQINQYERSLSSLSKIKDQLDKDGVDTNDIDNQITQIRQVLSRRKNGTHKWYGLIVRVDQEPINNVLMLKLTTNDGGAFHIPVNSTQGIIKTPIQPNKPRFIEYRQEGQLNLITYVEARTVDIVPFRSTNEQYYLIKRKSGLWATVGGHIEEGELESPLLAARRELHEETGAEPLVIRQLPVGWIKEQSNLESKEYHSWTLPFIALVDPKFEMNPSVETLGGDWFDKENVPADLHFAHHKSILNYAFHFLPILLKQFGKY